MRAADLDELNGVTPEGGGGPVWVYFLDDKGGFRADWVLVWATPHPDLGLTRARIRSGRLGRSTSRCPRTTVPRCLAGAKTDRTYTVYSTDVLGVRTASGSHKSTRGLDAARKLRPSGRAWSARVEPPLVKIQRQTGCSDRSTDLRGPPRGLDPAGGVSARGSRAPTTAPSSKSRLRCSHSSFSYYYSGQSRRRARAAMPRACCGGVKSEAASLPSSARRGGTESSPWNSPTRPPRRARGAPAPSTRPGRGPACLRARGGQGPAELAVVGGAGQTRVLGSPGLFPLGRACALLACSPLPCAPSRS